MAKLSFGPWSDEVAPGRKYATAGYTNSLSDRILLRGLRTGTTGHHLHEEEMTMALSAWFARHENLRSTRDSGLVLLRCRPEGDAPCKDTGRSEAEGWKG